MIATTPTITTNSTMAEILVAYPGAQRALFRRYHIGGCSHCAFSPNETLAELCQRNQGLDPGEVLKQLQASHEQDAKILISPADLSAWLKQDASVRLLDVRSREEFEAVQIPGSIFMSQDTMQQIMSDGFNTRPLVIVDHQGKQGLDAAAYFLGHGLQNVRCLQGGIDAWARDVDTAMRRYTLS